MKLKGKLNNFLEYELELLTCMKKVYGVDIDPKLLIPLEADTTKAFDKNMDKVISDNKVQFLQKKKNSKTEATQNFTEYSPKKKNVNKKSKKVQVNVVLDEKSKKINKKNTKCKESILKTLEDSGSVRTEITSVFENINDIDRKYQKQSKDKLLNFVSASEEEGDSRSDKKTLTKGSRTSFFIGREENSEEGDANDDSEEVSENFKSFPQKKLNILRVPVEAENSSSDEEMLPKGNKTSFFIGRNNSDEEQSSSDNEETNEHFQVIQRHKLDNTIEKEKNPDSSKFFKRFIYRKHKDQHNEADFIKTQKHFDKERDNSKLPTMNRHRKRMLQKTCNDHKSFNNKINFFVKNEAQINRDET